MDESEIPVDLVSDLSPLRAVLTEAHELYQELRFVGFDEKVATGIISHIVSDLVGSRDTDGFEIEVVDEDDEDDTDDDYDGVG